MKKPRKIKRDSSEVGARSAAQNDGESQAPSGRELSPKATEGERV